MSAPMKIEEIAARSDAAFDGRPFDGLGRAEKQRYRDRASTTLSAVAPLIRAKALEEAAVIAENSGFDRVHPHEVRTDIAAALRADV